MGLREFHVFVIAAIAAALLLPIAVSGQSSSSCTSAIVSLSPCLKYVTGSDTTPTASCCQQLAKVVQAEPECLCLVINGGASSIGISINVTQAKALPAACNVETPPVSRCDASAGPSTGPTAMIAPSGSKIVPGSSDGKGAATELNIPLIFMIMVISAYFSAATTV